MPEIIARRGVSRTVNGFKTFPRILNGVRLPVEPTGTVGAAGFICGSFQPPVLFEAGTP